PPARRKARLLCAWVRVHPSKSDGLECLQALEKIEHLEVKKISFSEDLFFRPPAIIINAFGSTDAQMSLSHSFFDERVFPGRALCHVMDQIKSGEIQAL